MFISTAYAQTSADVTGGGLESFIPLVLIFVVFYFLLIRPQQKKMKQHKQSLNEILKGDKVVTGGGIVGKVIKVGDDAEITVEIAKDVRVKVRRELISTVLPKNAPAETVSKKADNDDSDSKADKKADKNDSKADKKVNKKADKTDSKADKSDK